MISEKICNKCEKVYPLDTDHFFKKHDTKDGYTSKCKVCAGGKFTNHLNAIKPKNGYKFCTKCNRELLINIRFFPPDKLCKDGFRNVCRECGKDGHFMNEEYSKKRFFTKEDQEFFMEVYPKHSNKELIKLFYEGFTEKELWDRAQRLGLKGKNDETRKKRYEQLSIFMSSPESPFRIPKTDDHKRKISKAKLSVKLGKNPNTKKSTPEFKALISKLKKELGYWKGELNPRHINPLNGDKNGRWLGGITPLHAKIRNSEEYAVWRLSVFEKDNFTCQCCGIVRDKIEAHHVENFSDNIHLRFDINNGITLCKKCHNPNKINSFHHIYGTRNNNRAQLDEYIERYRMGEFITPPDDSIAEVGDHTCQVKNNALNAI
ncbi:HNH endonuclease [Paenibacillus sp. NAIST15-1]|uniref:HNH endonuclease n=1 Tax=Paenibacillus sp. NAIST15-1 TaxID=1605994 RepID=UPI00086D18D0|nr:HNH endonuclease [Paenibacillus sp. NAIST15-1]GAV11299.1 hypothetical protein PBN151_1226 [Paenibacillus sp. NAIST15-1]